MFCAVQRGPWTASRLANGVQLCTAAGAQPSSAMTASRGKAMYSMSAWVTIVSVHSGASTPSTADSGTPLMNMPGSQLYAVLTSMYPAQFWPNLVFFVYFMSRYALLAGDITRRVPFAAAAATAGALVVVSQYW